MEESRSKAIDYIGEGDAGGDQSFMNLVLAVFSSMSENNNGTRASVSFMSISRRDFLARSFALVIHFNASRSTYKRSTIM